MTTPVDTTPRTQRERKKSGRGRAQNKKEKRDDRAMRARLGREWERLGSWEGAGNLSWTVTNIEEKSARLRERKGDHLRTSFYAAAPVKRHREGEREHGPSGGVKKKLWERGRFAHTLKTIMGSAGPIHQKVLGKSGSEGMKKPTSSGSTTQAPEEYSEGGMFLSYGRGARGQQEMGRSQDLRSPS